MDMTEQQSWPLKAELFAELPISVANITFTPTSDVIFSHHPFFDPEIRVAKLDAARTGFTPISDRGWNKPKNGTGHYLGSVLGQRGDGAGITVYPEQAAGMLETMPSPFGRTSPASSPKHNSGLKVGPSKLT